MLSILMAIALTQSCGSSGVQLELNACAARDFEAAHQAMNAQWRLTLARLRADDRRDGSDRIGPPTAEVLLKSQRAWLAYRDAECALAGEQARGESMQPMLVSGCRATLTTERTKALKQVIETR